MDDRNFQVPNLQRDLAWIAGGCLAIAAGVGAAAATVVSWIVHRHRP